MIINKNGLSSLSINIRNHLRTNGNSGVDEVVRRIKAENFTQEELDFLYMCLMTEGYNPKTDSFRLYEGDNIEFLKLVDLVFEKINSTKN